MLQRPHILLFVFSMLSLTSMWGQRIAISDEVQLRNDISYDILGRYDDRILLFRDKANKQEIQFFDDQMRFRNSKELELEDRRVIMLGVTRHPEFFSLIYYYRRKNNLYIAVQQFDGKAQPIDTVHVVKVQENIFLMPDYKMTISEDRSKVAIFSSDREREMDIFVVDLLHFGLIGEHTLLFDDVILRRDFRSIEVSNQGLVSIILEKDNTVFKASDHLLKLFLLNPMTDQITSSDIPVTDRVTVDLHFQWDNINQCVVGAGLYSERSFDRSQGFFSMRYCLSDDAIYMQFHPFTEDILVDIYGKTVEERRGVDEVEVQDILLREDGGMILIGEIKKEFARRSFYGDRPYASAGYGYLSDYQYEDLILYSIQPNGDQQWATVLHKKQYSHDDEAIYSSYFIFKNPSKVRLVFNDEISKENTVSEYVIRGNGEMLRNSLFNTEYQHLQLRFRDAVQISSTEFVVPSQRQLRLNLVKVDYR
ncbi:MAG: hypothetical protein KDC28_11690 [Saprospiraceae bacterium]|nr:hypothetical protein [Saprospiraceae bacterium]MCB9321446.1 hypothetical protein [Lewinellaceae bacterium]